MRLDMCIKEKLNISRQKAQEIISQNLVLVNDKVINKPAYKVDTDDKVTISSTGEVLKYVGRGGLKLEKAVEAFNICLENMVCMDIGASTGGFTDCMLQNNASKVYSIDVGSEQLDESLKTDTRVISWENTDIRNVEKEMLNDTIDFIGCDVSFISLDKIFPSIKRLLKNEGYAVVLVKPQFEAGREHLTRNGIVKLPKVHKNVLKNILLEVGRNDLCAKKLVPSPIKGGDGNTEYLLYLQNTVSPESYISLNDIDEAVKSQLEG